MLCFSIKHLLVFSEAIIILVALYPGEAHTYRLKSWAAAGLNKPYFLPNKFLPNHSQPIFIEVFSGNQSVRPISLTPLVKIRPHLSECWSYSTDSIDSQFVFFSLKGNGVLTYIYLKQNVLKQKKTQNWVRSELYAKWIVSIQFWLHEYWFWNWIINGFFLARYLNWVYVRNNSIPL